MIKPGRMVAPTAVRIPTPRQGSSGTPPWRPPMDSLSALPRKSRRGSGSPLAGAPLLFLNLFAPIEFFRAVDTMASAFETERERPNWVAEGASSPQSLRRKDRSARRG